MNSSILWQPYINNINYSISHYINHYISHYINPFEFIEELDLSNSNLNKMPDLSCYTNLKKLNISFNRIHVISSKLPNSLEYFNCSFNYISELPDLSNCIHLKYLNFSSNMIHEFPPNLSDTVEYINCFSNKILLLPLVLPPSLKYFNCFKNNISHLPMVLPNGLEYLDCYANYIYALPVLPTTLNHLYAFNTVDIGWNIYPISSDHKYNIRVINIINRFREIYYTKKYGYKLFLYLKNK